MFRIIMEAIQNRLHPNDMIREDGFYVSKSWKPLVYSLKDSRKPPSQDSVVEISTGPLRSVDIALIRAPTAHPTSSILCTSYKLETYLPYAPIFA
jgi:hypothetical protein